MSRRRFIPLLLVLAGLISGAASAMLAAAASAGTIPIVPVREDRAGIHAPRTIRAGLTTFKLASNRTGHIPALQLVRLNDGVTYAQIETYLSRGDLASVYQHVTSHGGVAHAGADLAMAWTTNVAAGRYILVDDEANLIAPLRVACPPHPRTAPATRGTVSIAATSFRLPPGFGDGTWRIVDASPIQQEIALIAIAPGHTAAQVSRALATGQQPAWARPVGIFGNLSAGQAMWVNLRGLHGLFVLADYLPMLQGASRSLIFEIRRFS